MAMAHRLIVCFDGTWDRPDPDVDVTKRVESNVCRFYESVQTGPVEGGSTQKKWYDTGVGTKWYDQLAGGAFGLGLDQKIKEGYGGWPAITPIPIPVITRCLSSVSAGEHIRPAASSA
jgi:uncharacterized protein (DUF2235 family)